MLSFIIIGRDEGERLTRSLESVFRSVEQVKIKCEVIYVDSSSSDDSIQRATYFDNVKIYIITGDLNQAVARNSGAAKASGDHLFFVDGDIELVPSFASKAMEIFDQSPGIDCITGYLDHIYYDVEGNMLGREPASYKGSIPDTIRPVKTQGGIFLIKKSCWERLKGMTTKYNRNEDIDFSLRLAREGMKSIRIPYLMGFHHTIDHRNDRRMWKTLSSGATLYPAVLLRDHITDINKFKHTLRRHYTSLLLLASFLGLIHSAALSLFILAGFSSAVLMKAIRGAVNVKLSGKGRLAYLFERILFLTINDLLFWLSFIAFYPSGKTYKVAEAHTN